MAFLNPLVLFGLAAAAIPVLIHLFNFRKPRTVEFSSLVFLKELQQRTMRRVRLKQWLLLALRTLAIACLVLAFAQPTIQSEWASVLGTVPSSTAIVLDHSLSMTVRDAQGDLATQAQELATALVETAETGDELYVVGTVAGAAPRPFRNSGPALDALAKLEPAPGAASTADALARAFALLDGAANPNREVLFLSDLQAATFVDSVRVPAPDGVRIALLPIGERTHANVAVTDAVVQSRVVEAGEPAEIKATLVNYGPEPVSDYTASLYLEGERVAQAAADLAPRVPTTVTFTATPQRRGWLRGEVRIEADDFEWDNTRFLTLHVPETRRVLLVEGAGQNASLVALALDLDEQDGRRRFEVTRVAETALAAQDLDRFDVTVLVGPESLASGERAALARFVEQGGGLMLFPSARADASDYDALFDALGAGSLGPAVGAENGPPVVQVGRVDLEHPIFDGVFDADGAAGNRSVESPEIALARPYQPGVGDENTLMRLTTGAPFLQEIHSGEGTALVFAVAPDPAWSDFPVRGLFVPLLYRSVYYLAADADRTEALVVRAPGALRVSGASEGLRLEGPGTELVPAQRSVPGGVLLELDENVTEPGVYDVVDGERLVRRVAFNPDARESDLAVLDVAEAARRLEAATGAEVRVLDAAGGRGRDAAERLAEERTGVELWNLFLALALAFLVAEMLVAMRWKPQAVPA